MLINVSVKIWAWLCCTVCSGRSNACWADIAFVDFIIQYHHHFMHQVHYRNWILKNNQDIKHVSNLTLMEYLEEWLLFFDKESNT